MPESIAELFNCFGKYKHKNKKDSKSLNVFDLTLWVGHDVLENEYYGKKVDELKFLYDLFVLKNAMIEMVTKSMSKLKMTVFHLYGPCYCQILVIVI